MIFFRWGTVAFTLYLLTTGCSSAQKPAKSFTPPLVVASPTPIPVQTTQSPEGASHKAALASSSIPNAQTEEQKKRFNKILEQMKKTDAEFEQQMRETKKESMKNKYCITQKQLENYGQPMSQQCKKRLALLEKEAAEYEAKRSSAPPDDSWLDQP